MHRKGVGFDTMATTSPTFKLSLLAFPQSWDGAKIGLRILVMAQGDPLQPLLTGVPPAPDSPAFADAKLKFVAELIPSLDALPAPANATAHIPLTTTPPAQARALFQQLAAQFNIIPNPPGQTPRRSGFRTRKFLPVSYRNAFNFDRPRTPFALTDDTYHCMLQNPPITTPQPPPPSTVTWGRLIGFALRQPLLASALGLLYETSVTLPSASFFSEGGWLYLGLDPSSDFSPQLAVNPSLMQLYATRIPALTAPRPLFAAVLFPVLTTPPTDSYDDVFVEAEDYDDGFVKIVHGAARAHRAPRHLSRWAAADGRLWSPTWLGRRAGDDLVQSTDRCKSGRRAVRRRRLSHRRAYPWWRSLAFALSRQGHAFVRRYRARQLRW